MTAHVRHSMRFFGGFYRFSSRARQAICLLLAVSCLVVFAGVPLPMGVVVDSSTPFPCQGHRCGCTSAAQCWRSCCCQSPEERLAWARAHGVQPPDILIDALAMRASKPQRSSCCQHDDGPADADAPPTCESSASPPSPGQPQQAYGTVLDIFRCQGAGVHWLTAGAVQVSPPRLAIEIDLHPVAWVETPSLIFAGVDRTPDPPPPRI